MTPEKTKNNILSAIQSFSEGNVTQKGVALFEALGYITDRQANLDNPVYEEFRNNYIIETTRFNETNALVADWKYVDILFQLSKDEVLKQTSLFDTKQVDRTIIETYLFITIELSGKEYTRTQLSQITREVNRVFPMPVLILFKYNGFLTLSVINRRLHKRDDSKDVLEKVTQIKDIRMDNPHRAHIEILFNLSFDELNRKFRFTNFVELHNAWQKTLDIKELNKRFYSELFNWYLWAVHSVKFPNDVADDKDDMVYNAESVIRLLTRLIFVWFIKEKGLVPDELFDERKIKNVLKNFNPNSKLTSDYYRAILQNLFFATLNTQMDKDVSPEGKRRFVNPEPKYNNPDYTDQTKYRYKDYFVNPDEALKLFSAIPFLNGGLFECLDSKETDPNTGKERELRFDGFSTYKEKQAFVPDNLFFTSEVPFDLNNDYGTKGKNYKVKGLLNILNSYKFTITENTPLDEEVALDPELLGKVFENLLASYNPETQTTARKQTGSFYTPREIVNYMVDESLIAYLIQKLGDTTENEKRLRQLFSPTVQIPSFTDKETRLLIIALSAAKILDPACGSGAFPMGILHRMVDLLNKLDPDNKIWFELQKQRAIEETAEVFDSGDTQEREKRLNEINKAFDMSMNNPDYARKLFLIENCIYGVDIQQIAIQISKLRFFISLIVDQKVDDAKPNRNILSMPNLETRFVAANTLIGLDKPQQLSLMEDEVKLLEKELVSIRHKIFFTRKYHDKKELKKRDKLKRDELEKALERSGYTKNTATQMAGWNPFDPTHSATFFDMETMFGFIDGFDVVIGNPPYVNLANIKPDSYRNKLKAKFYSARNKSDLYAFFIEQGFTFLTKTGKMAYIIPHTWKATDSFRNLREIIFKNKSLLQIVNLEMGVFDATVKPLIAFFSNQNYPNSNISIFNQNFELECIISTMDILENLNFELDSTSNLLMKQLYQKIEFNSVILEKIIQFSRGIKTSDDERFILKVNNKDCYKVFRGKNIKAYSLNWNNEYVWYRPDLMKQKVGCVPNSREFFEVPEKLVTQRVNSSHKLLVAYDNKQNYFMDTVNVSRYSSWNHNISLKYLCGLLNSKLINFWYCNKYNMPTIGIYELHSVPIKISENQTQIIEFVDLILSAKKTDPQSNTTALEHQIDELVFKLYDLKYSEVLVVCPDFWLSEEEYAKIEIAPNP